MVKIRRRMDRGGWGFTARFGGVNAGCFGFGLLDGDRARSIGRVSLRNNDGGGVWKSQGGRWRNAIRRGEEPFPSLIDTTSLAVNLSKISWAAGIKESGRMPCQANVLLYLCFVMAS
jgi:hypothetical protein